MELTPGQRKAAFALIVLALAGLGVFLLAPGSPSAHTSGQAGVGTTGTPSAPPSPMPTAPSSFPSAPAASPSPGAVDIYQWLPFSQPGLAAAAAQVRAFAADYATYTYTESAASYVGRMKGLITTQLAATLSRGYATPGVAQVRSRQKQSATGSGQITALRAFGPSSLIFVVRVSQKITGTRGTSRTSNDYAITVTGAGTQWQVSDIELASAGNA